MTLIETYCYESEAPFDFPVVVFGGDADRMVGRPELVQWNAQTSGSFRLQMLAGDHLFLQSRRQDLLEQISNTLGLANNHVATASVG
jgi:surfactin synthase thioesterase subunit